MPRLSKENRERCVGMLQAGMSQNAVAATVGTAFFGGVSRPLDLPMTGPAVEDLE